MQNVLGAVVEVCFRTAEQGGRHAPLWNDAGSYRPHFRVHGGNHLGVVLARGPSGPVQPGVLVEVEVKFPYDVDYGALSEGAIFEILEGPRVVGEGRVLRLI